MREEGMNCNSIRELLVAYLDNEVTQEDRTSIEAHLQGCQQCREELKALSATQVSLRGALDVMANEVYPSPQVWERVKNRLDAKGNLLAGLRNLLSSRTPWRVATVTAAIVIIAALIFVWQFGGFGMVPEAEEEMMVPEEEEELVVAEEAPPVMNVRAVPDDAYYMLGQIVEIELSFENLFSTGTIMLNPFPPEIQVKPRKQDEVIFSIPAGSQSIEIKPTGTITSCFTWDQKDKDGKQVAPGWYQIILNLKDVAITRGTFSIEQHKRLHTVTNLLIQYPQGAMEKSLKLNQSETLNGITVILESIELTSEGMTINAFNTPPGYTHPSPSSLPTSPFLIASAEYSVDGGRAKQAGSPGIRFLEYMEGTGIRFVENGVRYTWKYLDPVPSDAKELTFRVRMSFNDKPEESLGWWEFKVPLE